ncbi:MAG: hypothetical protein PUB23_04210 [Bacilli bacterium]|nr:hypothetical protein [Bacilli bacterium]
MKMRTISKVLALFTILLSLFVGYSTFVVDHVETMIPTESVTPVCYIDSESRKFTSIEKAVEVANLESSQSNVKTIYVIPGTNPTISKIITINQYVKLYFPYEGTTVEDSGRSSKLDTFADSQLDANNNYLYKKNIIHINANIINYGTIFIGGMLGTSTSGQRLTSHTVNNHVQLNLYGTASIYNHGSLTNYGYIKYGDKTSNGGVYCTKDDKSIGNPYVRMPFSVYDFRGGTYTTGSAINNKYAFPINTFDFANCQVYLELDKYSYLYGDSTFEMNNSIFIPEEPMNVVGPSNSLFSLTNGKISIFYKSAYDTTTNDCYETSTKFNRTKLVIDGDLSVSSIALVLSGNTVVTSDFYCPISYKFDIEVKSGTTTITSGNRFKFLGGSSFTVDEGAKLVLNSDTVFYQQYVPPITTAGSLYPTANNTARLINNGTIEINNGFGGVITTQNTSAKIITSPSSSFSITTTECTSATREFLVSIKTTTENHTENGIVSLTVKDYVPSSSTEYSYSTPANSQMTANNNYYSCSPISNNFSWYGVSDATYGIRYELNSSQAHNSNTYSSFSISNGNLTLSPFTNDDDSLILAGLYYDSLLTNPLSKSGDNYILDSRTAALIVENSPNNFITIYAKWVANTVSTFDATINYKTIDEKHATLSYATPISLTKNIIGSTFLFNNSLFFTENYYYVTDKNNKKFTIYLYTLNSIKVTYSGGTLSLNKETNSIEDTSIFADNEVITIEPVYSKDTIESVFTISSGPSSTLQNTSHTFEIKYLDNEVANKLDGKGFEINYTWNLTFESSENITKKETSDNGIYGSSFVVTIGSDYYTGILAGLNTTSNNKAEISVIIKWIDNISLTVFTNTWNYSHKHKR